MYAAFFSSGAAYQRSSPRRVWLSLQVHLVGRIGSQAKVDQVRVDEGQPETAVAGGQMSVSGHDKGGGAILIGRVLQSLSKQALTGNASNTHQVRNAKINPTTASLLQWALSNEQQGKMLGTGR